MQITALKRQPHRSPEEKRCDGCMGHGIAPDDVTTKTLVYAIPFQGTFSLCPVCVEEMRAPAPTGRALGGDEPWDATAAVGADGFLSLTITDY